MWDGTHPSGHLCVLLRSQDRGRTWDDDTVFFNDPERRFMPAEPRLCEMQPGRIVCLFWMHSHVEQRNLPNHLTVSHDGGRTWSDLLDTGEWGQAPNLIHWKDEVLLTAHSQRERDIGLYVRLVDFSKDRWRTIAELNIWDKTTAAKVSAYATMAHDLKFGQPSFLRLDDGEVLATHWAVQNGRSCILTHRLRIT
jgi:sialidase-1